MDANEIIKDMNKKLIKDIKSGEFTAEKLDDITYECMTRLQEELKRNVNETIEESQKEIKKKMSHLWKTKLG